MIVVECPFHPPSLTSLTSLIKTSPNSLPSSVSALGYKKVLYSFTKLQRALEYMELARDGSTEAEAQVRAHHKADTEEYGFCRPSV